MPHPSLTWAVLVTFSFPMESPALCAGLYAIKTARFKGQIAAAAEAAAAALLELLRSQVRAMAAWYLLMRCLSALPLPLGLDAWARLSAARQPPVALRTSDSACSSAPPRTLYPQLFSCACRTCAQVRESNEKVAREYATMAAEMARPATSGEEALALKKYIGRWAPPRALRCVHTSHQRLQ